MKFFSVLFSFIFLMTDTFGQNITETYFNRTDIQSNITSDTELFDDIISDDVFYEDYNNTINHSFNGTLLEDDMDISEAVPPRVNDKYLDKSVGTFLDSGMKFVLETKHIFNEELNDSKSGSNAKDIWIAYSKSWGRVFDAFIREITHKILSSEVEDMDISLDCITGLLEVANGLKQEKDWAVKLFDSSGRPFAEGSLDGTITSLGAYDQCLSIEKEENNPGLGFIGQYCIIKYRLALPKKPKYLTVRSQVFNFTNTPVDGTFLDTFSHSAHAFYERYGRTGVCIPSTCSQSDFQTIVKSLISETHLNLTVNDCHTKVLPVMNSLQITIISIFCAIILLVILSTSLDLIIVYTKDLNRIKFIRVENRKKLFVSTLLSFSVYRNGKNLFDTSRVSSIECVNGIRVLSMVWILWTHTYLIPIKETFTFVREFMFTVEELSFQLILNGWVLVDTFFVVGAMLTTYTNFHRMSQSGGHINIPQQILNRFFRFWPSVTFTVGLIFIIPWLGSGPLWKEYFDIQLNKCYRNWWTTLSLINNWLDESQMCLLHIWYLSADFQLFIIALIFMIPLYKNPSIGTKLILITGGGSALAIGVRTWLLKQNPTVLYNTPNERDVYDQASAIYVHTYIHLGPYFVGLLLGYAVFKYKTIKINPFLNLFLWIIALFCGLLIMLSTYTLNRGVIWSQYSGSLYAGFHRIAWALCIAWIIFGCTTGNGGPINTFLSWKFFIPLGKLSFMIYLMHFMVIWVRYAYIRQPLPFSHYTMFCEFIVNLMISSCVSIVTYLTVEAPFLTLYRIYLSNLFKWSDIKIRKTDNKSTDNTIIDNRIIVTSKL